MNKDKEFVILGNEFIRFYKKRNRYPKFDSVGWEHQMWHWRLDAKQNPEKITPDLRVYLLSEIPNFFIDEIDDSYKKKIKNSSEFVRKLTGN